MNQKKKKSFLSEINKINPTYYKGKFSALYTSTGIESVDKCASFDSLLKHHPLFYFQTKNHKFLGISLARQSSDLQVIIAKHVLKELMEKNEEISAIIGKTAMMQYRIPKDQTSLKLISLLEWTDVSEFIPLTQILQVIQSEFRQKLKQIAALNLDD